MGCNHNCLNCSNPQFQDPNYPENTKQFSLNNFIKEILIASKKFRTKKIVLEGGDPLFKKNFEFIKHFLLKIKNKLDICVYTGFDVNYVKNYSLNNFKFLKCNLYDENLKQISKKTNYSIQFASINQQLYDSNFNLLSKNGEYKF